MQGERVGSKMAARTKPVLPDGIFGYQTGKSEKSGNVQENFFKKKPSHPLPIYKDTFKTLHPHKNSPPDTTVILVGELGIQRATLLLPWTTQTSTPPHPLPQILSSGGAIRRPADTFPLYPQKKVGGGGAERVEIWLSGYWMGQGPVCM